jgi:hypothetical protein
MILLPIIIALSGCKMPLISGRDARLLVILGPRCRGGTMAAFDGIGRRLHALISIPAAKGRPEVSKAGSSLPYRISVLFFN